MVTDFLLDWISTAVAWIGGLISLPAPPAFLGTLSGYVTTASSYVASTAPWMPWTLMVTVIGVWAACLAAGLAVKVVRIIASFLTLGGGSAA